MGRSQASAAHCGPVRRNVLQGDRGALDERPNHRTADRTTGAPPRRTPEGSYAGGGWWSTLAIVTARAITRGSSPKASRKTLGWSHGRRPVGTQVHQRGWESDTKYPSKSAAEALATALRVSWPRERVQSATGRPSRAYRRLKTPGDCPSGCSRSCTTAAKFAKLRRSRFGSTWSIDNGFTRSAQCAPS